MAQVYNKIFDPVKWEKVCKENKDIMSDFLLEYKARKMKDSTLRQYENDCRILLIYIYDNCGNQPITDLKKRDFRNLVLWLSEEKGMSSARCNRLMACCRSMLTYVEEDDEYDYDNNVATKVKGLPKEPVRDIVFLPDEVIMKLYNYLMEHERYRDATLLALGYESAGRKNELAQVEKSCILEGKDSTNIVIGKRGKKFPLVFFDLTKEAAKKYLEQRGDDGLEALFVTADGRPAGAENLYDWFVNLRPIIQSITGEECNANVHSLRHSALENMNQGTHHTCAVKGIGAIPIEKLKIYAHHSDISTTSRYLLPKDDKELEDLFSISIG